MYLLLPLLPLCITRIDIVDNYHDIWTYTILFSLITISQTQQDLRLIVIL
jgi:hypothetical protein